MMATTDDGQIMMMATTGCNSARLAEEQILLCHTDLFVCLPLSHISTRTLFLRVSFASRFTLYTKVLRILSDRAIRQS